MRHLLFSVLLFPSLVVLGQLKDSLTVQDIDKVEKEYEIKDNSVLKKIKNLEGTYAHPAYGDLTISKQAADKFNLKYYDFLGTIEYKNTDEFTAHLNFFLGAQNLDFKVIFANKKIKSLTVYMPNSQPLEFAKTSNDPNRKTTKKPNQ